MVSFVMCPLVVVPAVVGYYYGKHTEHELRDQEQEALWLGKEETLKDYVAHSYAPQPRVGELQQQEQQQEEEEEEEQQPDAQPREPSEQHPEGEGLCREASAVENAQVASVVAVQAAAETKDVTVPVVEGTHVADELTLASEIATEELAKLSSAAVAASDLCRTSFVKAVDGAAQELRRLEQAARTQFDSCGVLLGETTCLPSSTTTLTTTKSALPSSAVTSTSPSSLPLFDLQNDVTATFRTLWSQDEETKELPHQESPEQEEEQDDDDISLLHFEMLKNPTMDDNLLNKENHDIDTILPRKVTVQAVNKSVRDIELTLKTMSSPSLVEI
jgi:hypothetical protein